MPRLNARGQAAMGVAGMPVTRRINGGTIGLADRRKWLAKAKKVLGA